MSRPPFKWNGGSSNWNGNQRAKHGFIATIIDIQGETKLYISHGLPERHVDQISFNDNLMELVERCRRTGERIVTISHPETIFRDLKSRAPGSRRAEILILRHVDGLDVLWTKV